MGAPLLLLVVVTGFLKIAVNRNGQKKVAAIADARAPCYVRRDGRWQLLDSQDLVPGDVVRVQGDGWAIPSDLLLLQGSCVVNEAAITGPRGALPPPL